MLKRTIAFSLTLILVVAMAAVADDEGNQTVCPIMGNKINKDVYTDYNGYRIFFCCGGCIAKFNEDPEGTLQKMADAGVTPMKLKEQSVCPVTGEKLLNKDVFVDVDGKRVYLCCQGCIAKVKEDPKTYIKKIADRGEWVEDLTKVEQKGS